MQKRKNNGRDPVSLAVMFYGVSSDFDLIAPFRDAGVVRGIFALSSADRETVLLLFDRYASVVVAQRC